MRAELPYNVTNTYSNVLDIDDLGDCAIECIDGNGFFRYIVIYTKLGISHVHTWGPTMGPDCAFDMFPLSNNGNVKYSYTYHTQQFDEGKLVSFVSKTILTWRITDAKIIPIDEAASQIKNLQQYVLDRGN